VPALVQRQQPPQVARLQAGATTLGEDKGITGGVVGSGVIVCDVLSFGASLMQHARFSACNNGAWPRAQALRPEEARMTQRPQVSKTTGGLAQPQTGSAAVWFAAEEVALPSWQSRR